MDEIYRWSDIVDIVMCAPVFLDVALACDRLRSDTKREMYDFSIQTRWV